MPESSRQRIPVVFFQRKPRNVGNYSVEYIFDDVRRRLKDKIEAKTVISKKESKGIFPRLANCLEAFREKGEVNHITGDINYLGLVLSRKNTINTILDCVHLESSVGLKYILLKYVWLVIPEKNSKYLTAISESTKNQILKHYSCDPAKIIVIPVAISPDFQFKPRVFNRQKPRILQVGTAPNKNIPSLIQALEGISCILNIVGKPNSNYVEMCKERGIEYIYESGLTDQEMINRYEVADIVSLASTYEGFGMPILEAQATGRPIITSTLFSMPEVAGDSAVLVDPMNVACIRAAFLKIINDEEFRLDRITRGLENIKRYDPQAIADQYFRLYENIYNEQRRDRK